MKFDNYLFAKSFSFLNKNICYFDSGACTLIPDKVLNQTIEFFKEIPLSSFRSIYSYDLEYEISSTRKYILDFFLYTGKDYKVFFGSNSSDIFCKICFSILIHLFEQNDIILTSKDNHHTTTGAMSFFKGKQQLFWIEDMPENIDNNKVKAFFFQHISNVTGEINIIDIENIKFKFPKAILILDINQSLGCVDKEYFSKFDILFFSSHKYLGLTGLGISLINNKILFNIDKIISTPSGGNIIQVLDNFDIKFSRNTLELGTDNSFTIYSFLLSLKFIESFGNMHDYLIYLNNYFVDKIKTFKYKNILFLGNKYNKKPIFSIYGSFHSHDLGDYLFKNNILVRSGFLCCSTCNMPETGVVRVSISGYNNIKQIDRLFDVLEEFLQCI